MKDVLKITGSLTVERNGEIVRRTNNLVVNVGKAWVAQRMAGLASNMTYIGVGTGSTAEAVGDTTLTSPISGGRIAMNVSGGTISGATVTYAATWQPGVGTGAIKEAGIFDAASAGTMLAHTTFAVVNKDVGDTITISWGITISEVV